MPFPNIHRVIFNKNPLDQVVCQLRFSPILRIEAEIPYEFQEKIKGQYPDYVEVNQLKLQVSTDEQAIIPNDFMKELSKAHSTVNHQFKTEDGDFTINLTRTFLALTARRYERWENFLEMLKTPFDALIELYDPKIFTRIGLRYVNIIQRSLLNLEESKWNELLKPEILGLLSSESLYDIIFNLEGNYELKLDEDTNVRIITQFVKKIDENEIAFKIDNDFYTATKTKVEETEKVLKHFNEVGTRIFQWFLSEKLLSSLEPREIE